jgi:hypothetical protein
MPRISVVEPLSKAFDRMRFILFGPFDLSKWLVMGFCAFLAQLGSGGGGGFNFSRRFGGHDAKSPTEAFRNAADWVMAHLPLVIAIGTVAVVFAVALMALLKWLGSRGEFMLLDGIVKNRGAVKEPWTEFRSHGNSLFGVRFILAIAVAVVLLIIVAACLALALSDIRQERFGIGAILAIALFGLTLLPLFICYGIAEAILIDFVTPIMYRRNISAMAAIHVLWTEILPGNVGHFALFYLMKILLGAAAAVIILMGTCLTCCIAALPYINAVVFLPIFVFMRCYGLFFLEQFSPEWQILPPLAGPGAAEEATYRGGAP